jgi:hypothetical protein
MPNGSGLQLRNTHMKYYYSPYSGTRQAEEERTKAEHIRNSNSNSAASVLCLFS